MIRGAALIFFLIALAKLSSQVPAGKQNGHVAIGFWNLENLYDTINDPSKNDDDFTPDGLYKWDSKKYFQKIEHLSEVIAEMATERDSGGLELLGLCEVENLSVLEDLLQAPLLWERHYRPILAEGPDLRGIDPALIYRSESFEPLDVLSFPVKVKTDTSHLTRNILFVKGLFFGVPLAVLVNHWPSRRGGEWQSRPNRLSAAEQVRRICDSLYTVDPGLHIVVMGDFNDDPVDESVRVLTGDGKFYNPMSALFQKGIGTLAWRDNWNLFDQIIINQTFLKPERQKWSFEEVIVFNKPFLRNRSGNFRGYPYRTFQGNSYAGGYSDHFPVYILLNKEKR